jgi:predicted membrane protein
MRNADHRIRNRGIWPGILLVVIGCCILASRAMNHWGYSYPGWIFSWPMILIAIGLFIGVSHGFRGVAWAILILIGGVFLSDNFGFLPFHFRIYFWPLGIIVIGLLMVTGSNRRRVDWGQWKYRNWKDGGSYPEASGIPGPNQPVPEASDAEFVHVTAVLGSVKKVVSSRNVSGGDITTVFAEAMIDLRQADITGMIHVDVTAVLGSIKIIVPSTWNVKSEVVAVMGRVEDRRISGIMQDPAKILVLDGTTFMGNIILLSRPI